LSSPVDVPFAEHTNHALGFVHSSASIVLVRIHFVASPRQLEPKPRHLTAVLVVGLNVMELVRLLWPWNFDDVEGMRQMIVECVEEALLKMQ
jgi:hypothetical protein